MTDGTSQGLFVVVAIVIFGIFVALSYTVFGNDGLSGGLTGMFEDATGQVEYRVNQSQNVVTNTLSDLHIETVRLRGHSGEISENVYLTDTIQYEGEDSVEIHLNPEYRRTSGRDDVTFYFTDRRFARFPEGADVTVSYMVKGDVIPMTSRLGRSGPRLEEHLFDYQVTSEWTRFEHTFDKVSSSDTIQYVLYSTDGGVINIADFSITVTK